MKMIKLTTQETFAILANGHLCQSLTILSDAKCDVEVELNTLKSVDEYASRFAEDSESNIAIVSHGISSAVQSAVDLPELETRVASHSSEDSVESEAWTVAHLRDGPRYVGRTKDISGDQVEYRACSRLVLVLKSLQEAYPKWQYG